MKKLIFAIFSVIIVVILAFLVVSNLKQPSTSQLSIVSTNFIGYDFTRAITKDTNAAVEMLLKPGTDAHSFEPAPEDIIKIKNASLFIYNGGESDAWVAEMLKDNEIPAEKTLCLMNTVELKTEGPALENEGSTEGEPEYDEHVWTSLKNAITIINIIKDKLSQISPADATTYAKNTQQYTNELQNLDNGFRALVRTAQRTELIFADRFPFRYFTDEYGLSYAAAFPGCAEQTEASSATIAYLIDKVKTDDIPVILKIELSTGNLADTIAEATGAKVLTLSSAHNISAEDFQNGVTYLDILKQNLETLNQALN